MSDVRRDAKGTEYVPIGVVAELLERSTSHVARMCRLGDVPAWRETLADGRRSQWRINAEWARPLIEARATAHKGAEARATAPNTIARDRRIA